MLVVLNGDGRLSGDLRVDVGRRRFVGGDVEAVDWDL